MIKQLRLLDPSVSAEIGTPERKIIDTVAEELANAQIDLNQVNSGFDLDSKFGSDLDAFLSIFGFSRQTGAQATGYVTFSRSAKSSYAIPIPQGTQVEAPSISNEGSAVSLIFATTAYGEIPAEELEVTVPVRCLTTGSIGNVAANTITRFARTPVLGVTSVTNKIATANGADVESDPAFKVRFKNTVFRNLAGTEDQYLALAVATAFTTKANAVGPISRYQEYIQVPDVDDATADPDSGISGNGSAGEWTTALSSIPYSKHIYSNLPYYLTTQAVTSTTNVFYRQEVDFKINTSNIARDRGDTYRGRISGSGYNVYTDPGAEFQPNLTLFNVYTGENANVVALRPGDIVLFEHSYMSDASRNDYERQLLNCVDVFINGQNPVQADAITVKPNAAFASVNAFSISSESRFYVENFRRIDHPEERPVAGNFFQPLFWTPVLSVPSTVVTAEGTYREGIHYWAIEDVSDIGRSVRARTGIEWSNSVLAQKTGDSVAEQYTGPLITADTATDLEIIGYTYDRNIVDLQASLDTNKQVTTDVLAHQGKIRYFKLDITVMYAQGVSVSTVNSQIHTAVENYLNGAYFGTTIQLSDLLQVIHNVSGVDNVRWSRDITEKAVEGVDASGNPRNRMVECDKDGNPLCTLLFQRKTYGHTGVKEVQVGYYTGHPEKGFFYIKYPGKEAAKITYGSSAATIKTKLTEAGFAIESVKGEGTPLNPFEFTFSSEGYRSLMSTTSHLISKTTVSETTAFDSDFFLKDDELPALPTGELSTDTLPGLVIRKRAQGTWGQL